MVVGITGSRNGINEYQKNVFEYLIDKYEISSLHHGMCVGADSVISNIAYDKGIYIIGHPPSNDKMVCNECKVHITLDPKDYLKRNKNIVDKSNVLIAFPSTDKEVLRSGTWATIRYSYKKTIIIYPTRIETITY